MGLRINNNVAALNSYNNLQRTDKAVSSSLEKLSSGYRINKAADDAAGLAVSEGLRAQISGLTVAARNAQDGANVVQTADGALGEVSTMLRRIRDLAVQSANGGSQDSTAQAAAQAEVKDLLAEIDQIGSTTKFGAKSLFSSTDSVFQVGANAGDVISFSIGSLSSASVGGSSISSVDISTTTGASSALSTIDSAITALSSTRAALGAKQNRFEHAINNLNISIENITASESAIRDTDMAAEMTKFTKNQILSQAGTSMLAQANSSTQNILSLLRG
ncbi:flagellin N-terminal helical domain-containing protein [Kineococcus sp. SYSU DK001]|uniref:flagellin N-terminal helical domain-containing protein n=1 Tax=Kineococcus sp. SYSU DK001 TaxID=3383122 RepID=UPI003D7DA536